MIFILILSILFLIVSFGGALAYLNLLNKAILLTQKVVFEQAFVRCFYIFVASLLVTIASCTTLVIR